MLGLPLNCALGRLEGIPVRTVVTGSRSPDRPFSGARVVRVRQLKEVVELVVALTATGLSSGGDTR